ncbi:MAG: DUF2183 domain-containing protein, partial [Azoarcus sp.]|jgi:hypothetical protein|nr:DUF2183 domain-containing protein [Azoarcus sp.]
MFPAASGRFSKTGVRPPASPARPQKEKAGVGPRMRMWIRAWLSGLLPSLLLVNPLWAAERSTLDADESVMFFPAIARAWTDGSVTVDIEAWVFQEERQRVLDFALTSYMGVDLDEQAPESRALFEKRMRYFHTDSERNETIFVRIVDRVVSLPATNSAGRTHGEIKVGGDLVRWRDDGVGRVFYALEAPGHAMHGLEGYAWVLPEEGVFVVSDIDDTIKHSNVRDKKALLRNTFLAPFQAVPGMADWYREMAGHEPGAFFHYLSASPLELYPALSAFLREEGFPAGNMHLRESTAWRALYANQQDSMAHKTGVLDRLAAAFPRRRFILIGDSGESDPEIYADFARRHPGQITAIYIRDVSGEDENAPRYRQTFMGIAAQRWRILDRFDPAAVFFGSYGK